MQRSPIVRLVDLCTRRAWAAIALVVAIAGFSAIYAAQHFAIATDIKELFPRDLPWTQRAYRYLDKFPEQGILAVVEAPTPELVDRASARLTATLRADREHFHSVEALQGSQFFARNALLYLPAQQVAQIAGSMDEAAPLVGALSADPSLRGVLGALSYGLMGVANGAYSLDALVRPMTLAADTVDDVLAGRPAHFSWQNLANGKPASPGELRRFIQVRPVLDFDALQPGKAATDAIRRIADRLDLAGADQARVRLTGLVPMNDAQFAALRENAGLNATITLAAVLLILWLALRSWRIIAAAAISLFCGLAIAAALGLFLVGTLNLISVAFFVLFVGLGVDFGIQFAVRYRAERHDAGALRPALVNAAQKAGGPLSLAAAATALGFAAFVPTSYRGLSELGLIAGLGMLVAFLTSITLLPALIAAFKPPAEGRPMGFTALAPVDRFLERHRIGVVAATLGIVALAAPLLYWLQFDFNPLHLQDPKTESVATFLELRRDPQTGANAVEAIKPDLAAADAAAARLAGLPEVARTTTLSSFIPADQDKKLATIREVAAKIAPVLEPGARKPAPADRENADRENIAALLGVAGSLRQFAAMSPGTGADAATRLAGLLVRLANAAPAARADAAAAFVEPLRISLAALAASLNPEPVTIASLPESLRRAWVAPDGAARVQALPQGDPDDTGVLRRFVSAVLAVEPDATGPAVMLYEAGNTILRAFIEAGAFALVSIFVLLWVTLRRLGDVAMTLVPLLLAAVLTLELCVVLGLPLNFANIIALPLLLGVGVAFKIYYVMAWRRGRTALVQSTLSRAVIFSAMTTGTAFGSLWLSNHPGTSSMGELMGLALLCTMGAAVLFQPALMGPPRRKAAEWTTQRPVPLFADDEDEAVPQLEVWEVERRAGPQTGAAAGSAAVERDRKQEAVSDEIRR
jgi:hopanoid biosynthesis associated RND transporter like protein HpnN